MRIAIEALGIDRPGGGRVATLNLLTPLFAIDTENEYVVYLSAPEPSIASAHGNVRQRIVPVRNRFASRAVLQVALPILCRRDRIDVVHFVKNQVVPGTGARSVATVYDLTTLRHPEAYPAVDVWYWRHVLPRQYRRMDRLIAISQSTADDLVALCRLPPERIRVIHCGYDPAYRVPTGNDVERARARYGLRDTPYFIHVGNLSLKKNLALLLEAFLDFRRRTQFAGKLVLVGADYAKGRDARFFERLASPEARESVLLTGHVPQEALVGLYGGALAFVFPSLHEGFGLVALEAMACGTPVVAHAAGAVREVVGDAGIVVDSATDTSAWSRILERIAAQPELRAELRAAGLERVHDFDPVLTARRTLAVYRDAMSEPAR
jgi:glycosyltransferase involved in cell wall biosynthesis